MKIVHIINGLGRGGGERLLVELVRGLERNGHSSSVYCLTRTGVLAEELRELGVAVHPLSYRGLPAPSGIVRLLLDLRSAHVMHTHFFYSDLVGSLLGHSGPHLILFSLSRNAECNVGDKNEQNDNT